MKEEYVTYEQAVKLKELGFDGNGLKTYIRQGYYKFPNGYISPIKHDGDGILVQFRKEDAEKIPAPRLDQAQKWLREAKKIHIEPKFQYGRLFNIRIQSETLRLYKVLNSGFDTYELALSAGIDKALELLTDNQPTEV